MQPVALWLQPRISSSTLLQLYSTLPQQNAPQPSLKNRQQISAHVMSHTAGQRGAHQLMQLLDAVREVQCRTHTVAHMRVAQPAGSIAPILKGCQMMPGC
jgi:hypothetical protein